MKKNLRHLILLLTAILILTGCSEQSQISSSHPNNGKNLGSLQTRDRIIRLETGGKFSILDLNGNPVAVSLSKPEFQEKFPLLFRDFEKAIAGEDITPDASLAKPANEILK